MSTAAEHYTEAERLLREAEASPPMRFPEVGARACRLAEVHARLAGVAATIDAAVANRRQLIEDIL